MIKNKSSVANDTVKATAFLANLFILTSKAGKRKRCAISESPQLETTAAIARTEKYGRAVETYLKRLQCGSAAASIQAKASKTHAHAGRRACPSHLVLRPHHCDVVHQWKTQGSRPAEW
jgi:hypothetical protein